MSLEAQIDCMTCVLYPRVLYFAPVIVCACDSAREGNDRLNKGIDIES